MKKILCPTDFSDTAHKAVAYAAKMAQKCGAELHLFHVHAIWHTLPTDLTWGKFITMKAVKDHLDEICLEASRVYKITCYGEVHANNRSVSSVIAATGTQYDLIIMGTDGPDSLYEFFAGSTTYQVVRESQVPILLLPDGCDFQEITHVAYAYDYFRDQHTDLSQLITWVGPMQARITILQVMKQRTHQTDEKKLQDAQLPLKQLYADIVPLDFSIVYSDDPIGGINFYTERNACDALAVCVRDYALIEKLFHKSVIRKLSVTTKYPLFVFQH